MDKPLIKQMEESVPSANTVTEGVSNATKTITDTFTNAKENIKSSLNDFSSKSVVNASSEFLNSNGLLAKFAFIILVFLLFLMILKISITILAYFLSPTKNPYIVRGLLSGSEKVIVVQNPTDSNSVPVLRSNDRYTGVEFTWSLWLLMKPPSNTALQHIFSKGDDKFYYSSDMSGTINTLNGPGLYVQPVTQSDTSEYKLIVLMDHINQESDSTLFDTISVPHIPTKKWVHVAIRLENMILDVYVNGSIVKRTSLTYAPKQNYNNVTVHGNGGFAGDLSNLKYYNYALNVFEINNILMFGPDTSTSSSSSSYKNTTNTTYLSTSWYTGQYR